MQQDSHLNIKINPGAPASSVPRNWFLYVNNVLKYLTVINGRLITSGDKWTIVCNTETDSGDGLNVAGTKAAYKVVTLLPSGEDLIATWDYVRLP